MAIIALVLATVLAGMMGASSGPVASANVRVIDGDTIVLDGERIRIVGMDACELGQTMIVDGREWDCGEAGRIRMVQLIGSNAVRCEGERRDVYGRRVARCFVGELDLGRQLVAEGLAVVYRFRGRPTAPELVAVEAEARRAGIGLWSAEEIIDPGAHRRRARN
ncbi:MAG: thermonuclease family protein [Oceanicaulis sp.]|uniref:thermonuclease family protein n=1 Tax=Glycocaulis sp. TaxID=1969725 RepID=UPI0025BDCCB5|nr:thermonuclease family protein [Glycocaulis sp.]MCC5982642.1 thermonuclease family protein [Oceanicaulis sp.]MCH8522355.1 thermonuclease family protein [Glycocaulis sp.]